MRSTHEEAVAWGAFCHLVDTLTTRCETPPPRIAGEASQGGCCPGCCGAQGTEVLSWGAPHPERRVKCRGRCSRPLLPQRPRPFALVADLSELNLAKTTSIAFPEGKEKLLTFEVTIKPDEGHYKCANGGGFLCGKLRWRRIRLLQGHTGRAPSEAEYRSSQGGLLPFLFQRADCVPARGAEGQVPHEGVPFPQPASPCSVARRLGLSKRQAAHRTRADLDSILVLSFAPRELSWSPSDPPRRVRHNLHSSSLPFPALWWREREAGSSGRVARSSRCGALPLPAQVYHPNIDNDGNVCLNILREDWKPVLSINSIIYGLQYLFLVRQRGFSSCPLVCGSSCEAPSAQRASGVTPLALRAAGPELRRPAEQGGSGRAQGQP